MGSRDPTFMDTPVRDSGMHDMLNINEVKERHIVTSLSRNELEDRYLRLREESTELKKKSHTQEEKMKQMATKLLRLVKDRKRLEEGGSGIDIESREMVEELRDNVKLLERQNNQLKSKLLVAKQQLQSQGKRTTPYDHVKSRINTGIPPKKAATTPRQQRIKEQIRVASPSPVKDSPRAPPPVLPQPRYGHSLLEESRLEKRELEDVVGNFQQQIGEYEDQIDYLQQQIKQKELDHKEDMQKLHQRVSESQRTKLQENIELVKLQREVKDKVAQLQHLQGKYENLEELLNKVKLSHGQVLEEMEGLTSKLKDEKLKNDMLVNEMKQGNISQRTNAEKDEIISDLKAEVDLLKDAHDKLLHSTFDAEREREHRAKERQYQIRIAQLEATIKADVSEKNIVLDKLSSERDLFDNSKAELRELQVKYYELKEKYEDLSEKLKFFSNESAADFNEIQEALLLVKTRKEQASHDLSFLEKVDEAVNNDVRKEMQELQAAHAETINELEKTRSMLLLQHNINRDYQREVEETTKRMEELKLECDTRIKEYAQLLDIRAQRIKKLEAQLRDVAYGTKQFIVKSDNQESLEEEDLELKLERGQNVFEIHVGKLNITKNGLEVFGGAEPTTFISYEFFEYELQATPVAHGTRHDYNHTSQYTVQVDDFFLHYLQKETMVMEFHQAFGTEYRTVAKAAIRFNEVLNRSHGRLHATVSLLGSEDRREVATVEYWMRLRVPMEQALRLYKERTKALGYITSNDLKKLENPNEKSLKDSGINELKIGVLQCMDLKSNVQDVQPSAYCVYKFYDFGDHDTDIVANSNSPQFHDFRNFPVPMTEELDNYLKNSMLDIYVFDDLDPVPTSYVGKASIPLIPLCKGKKVKGTFELQNTNGQVAGVVEVCLSWEYTYLPASAKKVRTYAKAVETLVEHDSVYTRSSRYGTMQSMVSSGKLFEPQIVSMSKDATADPDFLEPTKDTDQNIASQADSKESLRLASRVASKESLRLQLSDDQSEMEAVVSKLPAAEDPSKSSKSVSRKSTAQGKLKPVRRDIQESELREMSVDQLVSAYDGGENDIVANEGTSVHKSDEELLEEELRKTVEAPDTPLITPDTPGRPPFDTMFEEEISELSDSDVVITPRVAGRIAKKDAASIASDSTEDDVVVTSPTRSSINRSLNLCTITVTVVSLTLFEDAPVLAMDNIKQLFVSYNFLNYDPEQLETPVSLPKPRPNRPINFNFKKVFHVDAENHETSRQYLLHLLMPDHPNEGRMFFTVVSDPVDEDDDCSDVGIAYVDFIQMLRDGKDLNEADIDVFDLLGDPSDGGDVIGCLTVSVQALDALRSLYEEEMEEETEEEEQ